MGVAYPRIPVQLGGGRTQKAQILIKQDSIKGVRELGIPIHAESNLTDPIEIIYEGSEGYAIRSGTGKVIQIKKDIVAGTIVDL